jgi:hypothetical protein
MAEEFVCLWCGLMASPASLNLGEAAGVDRFVAPPAAERRR